MIEDVARGQAGVVSRRQLVELGVPTGRIRAQLSAGRWQALATGVYATFTGPPPPLARVWAAVLRAGPDAAAGPGTTLWLAGVTDRRPERLDVVVPLERRVRGVLDVDVRRRAGLAEAVHPVARPPRLRIEEAVLDLSCDLRRPAPVVDVVLQAVQRRLTTAERLQEHLAVRRAHPWRALLGDLLGDVDQGVRSALERRWLYDVQRAHGLPPGRFNRADAEGVSRRYRDVEYPEWQLIVELDGREAHPDAERFRDRRRDNRVTVSGRTTLRYGWREVAGDPCGVAAEVVAVLGAAGWRGRPRPCGPGCPLGS